MVGDGVVWAANCDHSNLPKTETGGAAVKFILDEGVFLPASEDHLLTYGPAVSNEASVAHGVLSGASDTLVPFGGGGGAEKGATFQGARTKFRVNTFRRMTVLGRKGRCVRGMDLRYIGVRFLVANPKAAVVCRKTSTAGKAEDVSATDHQGPGRTPLQAIRPRQTHSSRREREGRGDSSLPP